MDLSKESLYAWEAAKSIAKRFGAALEAVWCVEPVAAEVSGLSGLSRLPRYRDIGLRRLRASLGPDARLHAVDGYAAVAIPRLARGRRSDLLVIGLHRRPGLVRWVQGSMAETLVRASPCPVLAVPRAWREPRWVLAPVGEQAYARRGLLAAAVLARAYRGRLAMLEVVPRPELGPVATKRMGMQFERMPAAILRDVRPELDVRVGKPVLEILRGGRRRDLIVLVARRKSLLGDAVLGTTVERVLRHSRVPVLAIPSP